MSAARIAQSLTKVALAGAFAAVAMIFVSKLLGPSVGFALLAILFFAILAIPFAFAHAVEGGLHLARGLTWWHGLWAILLLSGLVFRVRDASSISAAPIDAWAAFRIALVSTTGVILCARLFLKRTEWLGALFRGLLGALTIYAIVCAASTLWSIYPAWTLYKSVEYLVDVSLLAAVLVTVSSAGEYESLFDWTWALLGGLLLSAWVGAVLWPEEAFVRAGDLIPVRLSGVIPVMDQNTVGEFAAVLAIVSMTRLMWAAEDHRGRAFYGLLHVLGVVTLVISQTRVAIVGFLIGALLVLLLSRRIYVIALLTLAVIVLFSFTRAGELSAAYWQRGEQARELESLSGRLDLWQTAMEELQRRPTTGYGAYAGGRFLVGADVGNTVWPNTLNTYVEVALGTGIWGLLPLLAGFLGTWGILIRAVVRHEPGTLEYRLALEAIGAFGVISARSFFSSNLIWHPALPFFAVLGFAELMRRNRKRNSFEQTEAWWMKSRAARGPLSPG